MKVYGDGAQGWATMEEARKVYKSHRRPAPSEYAQGGPKKALVA
jgi:hypothetical protein